MHELGVALPYRGKRWYGEPPDEVRDEYFHQATLMGLDAMTAPESSERLSTRLWRRYAASALALLEGGAAPDAGAMEGPLRVWVSVIGVLIYIQGGKPVYQSYPIGHGIVTPSLPRP